MGCRCRAVMVRKESAKPCEVIMDWIIGCRIPLDCGSKFQVQTKADQVREVERKPNLDYSTLWFTDCTHPAQNAVCSESYIKAWRFSEN
jgi:hypothetical protein